MRIDQSGTEAEWQDNCILGLNLALAIIMTRSRFNNSIGLLAARDFKIPPATDKVIYRIVLPDPPVVKNQKYRLDWEIPQMTMLLRNQI